MPDTFDLGELTAELTVDEGRRSQAYVDTVGLVTIGIGRELTRKGLSDAEIDLLFANDVRACCDVMDREIPWWRSLAPNEQRVMINLCFMGWGSFSQFHNFMLHAEHVAHERGAGAVDPDEIIESELNAAVAELQNSRWWEQVKSRGPRVAARLLGTYAATDTAGDN